MENRQQAIADNGAGKARVDRTTISRQKRSPREIARNETRCSKWKNVRAIGTHNQVLFQKDLKLCEFRRRQSRQSKNDNILRRRSTVNRTALGCRDGWEANLSLRE